MVRIDFGKTVSWLALPPEVAMGLAGSLMNHAQALIALRTKK
jgi:hypothetical protein